MESFSTGNCLDKLFTLYNTSEYTNPDHLNPRWSFFVPFLENYPKNNHEKLIDYFFIFLKIVVNEGLKYTNGLTFSPDQTQLYVTESATHWLWIYQIQADGKLSNKQRFGWLQVRDNDENAWSDGLKCDKDGRIYVTTKAGIQILDQLGRVNAIIPIPIGQASNLCFGGRDFDTMYVTAVDKFYRRKLNTRGVNVFEMPFKPKPSGLLDLICDGI